MRKGRPHIRKIEHEIECAKGRLEELSERD